MDTLNEDMLHFWATLNKHGVQYIMVGGFAVSMHGYARTTKDVDIWIKDSLKNRKKLALAFGELGYEGVTFDDIQFIPGWTNFTIGIGIVVDIMTQLRGLENIGFDECFNIAPVAEIEGLPVPFLHINHLIDAKKAANRPKDQLDVIELQRIKKLLEEDPNLQKP